MALHVQIIGKFPQYSSISKLLKERVGSLSNL